MNPDRVMMQSIYLDTRWIGTLDDPTKEARHYSATVDYEIRVNGVEVNGEVRLTTAEFDRLLDALRPVQSRIAEVVASMATEREE